MLNPICNMSSWDVRNIRGWENKSFFVPRRRLGFTDIRQDVKGFMHDNGYNDFEQARVESYLDKLFTIASYVRNLVDTGFLESVTDTPVVLEINEHKHGLILELHPVYRVPGESFSSYRLKLFKDPPEIYWYAPCNIETNWNIQPTVRCFLDDINASKKIRNSVKYVYSLVSTYARLLSSSRLLHIKMQEHTDSSICLYFVLYPAYVSERSVGISDHYKPDENMRVDTSERNVRLIYNRSSKRLKIEVSGAMRQRGFKINPKYGMPRGSYENEHYIRSEVKDSKTEESTSV